MRISVLLVALAFVTPALGQQAPQGRMAIAWQMFSSKEDPHVHSMLFGTSFAAAPVHDHDAQNPFLVGFALKVGTPKASIELLKPVHIVAPGLSPPQSAMAQLPQTIWGTYYAPQPFDGLVSLVSAIRLNLGGASDVHEGFSWSLMYGGTYNGQTNVGLSMRYKVRF